MRRAKTSGSTAAGSAARRERPERLTDRGLWTRRAIARLIDLTTVAVLFGVLWVAGSAVLETRPGACDPAPSPGCNVAAQSDRLDQVGNTIIEFTLTNGRVIDSDHTTFRIGDRVYIADPPSPSVYLVTLAYVLLVLVTIQGVSGWTPGKAIAAIRLADSTQRCVGPIRSFVRWALPDGAIGVVGILGAIVGAPWPLRLLVLFVPLGVLRVLGEFMPALAGPLRDDRLGVGVIARANFIAGRPLLPVQPQADQPADPATMAEADDGQGEDQPQLSAEPMAPSPALVPDDTVAVRPLPGGEFGAETGGEGSDFGSLDEPESEPEGKPQAPQDHPYPPQWDGVREAYICWEPVAEAWLEWDDQAKQWGPISR